MKLFNFDHQLLQPHQFEIGPFVITVSEEHCKNLKLLPRRSSQNYTHNADHVRHVVRTPADRGGFFPTANVDWPSHPSMPPSVLFPELPGPDAGYDLVMLLSFLSGRRVYLEDELEWDPRRSYGESILSGLDLVLFAKSAWSSLPTIASRGLGDALVCLVNAAQSPDLIGWGAYVSAAFDSIVTSWAKGNGRTKFQDAILVNQAREVMKRALLEEGVSADTTGDILARFNQIKSPSALAKIRWFVEDCELFPKDPTDEQLGRLRRLNTVRNAIAHSGSVRIEPELGVETSYGVAATTVFLTQEIAELHFARDIMGIETFGMKESVQTIRKFFDEGSFRGQRVFDEKYEEFLARSEHDWVEYGRYESAPISD